MEKKYNHKLVEEKKHDIWLKKGYFKSGTRGNRPFSIVIPPPNVTGNLHLGHAWDTTLQDIIIRYKRMDGFDTLWLPGMDHAGIATQARIDAKLRAEGINPRQMKREAWLEKAWEWKETYALNIRNQWAKLGLSLDYDKERFTLDEGLNKAVNKVFIDLYNKGLIYRGKRIINWDPEAKTALSNEEVIYQEKMSDFYYIRYYLVDSNDYIVVATTRPETMFGDVAVAINPKDKRYQKYLGKKVKLPVLNKEIPIITDEYVDLELGTGALKITPAHDLNDFEVGKRHNLETILCLNKDGTMNENAGKYVNLDRFECRRKVVEFLKNNNYLEKIEKIKHNVGHSERSEAIVEPYLSEQWFVKMKPLAKQVLELQKTEEKVDFIPKRFEKILTHWMENIDDWCISRQLWWGHQIPAWHKDDEIAVSVECPGEGFIRDPDVLDTWFSSALWPFSTLGWPDNLDQKYFPNNCLVTGYDIIFFWVSRMIVTSVEFTGKRPFEKALIHGLIRDKDGRKMSKSLGNGVDPMAVVEEYGADALRFFLATNSAPGQDLRYDAEKVRSTWNFINKLWNASRFVIIESEEQPELSNYDKWILNQNNLIIEKVRKHMENYDFHLVGTELYQYIWHDFCDWYIEFSKVKRNNKVLKKVLIDILKMIHPFIPYVTEEIYQQFNQGSIMISEYPQIEKINYEEEAQEIEEIKNIISKIRHLQKEMNLPKINLINNLENKAIIDNNQEIFAKLLKCQFNIDESLEKCDISFGKGKVTICYLQEKDETKKAKLIKEKEKLENSIAKRKNLLANSQYINNAPTHIVEADRYKLSQEENELIDIKKELNH